MKGTDNTVKQVTLNQDWKTRFSQTWGVSATLAVTGVNANANEDFAGYPDSFGVLPQDGTITLQIN